MNIPKVYIRCDAGGTYGLGHVVRCCNLAREFCSHNLEVVFILQPNAPEGVTFVQENGFNCIVSHGIVGSEEDFVFLHNLVNAEAPYCLLIDSRDLTVGTSTRYRNLSCLICIDDEKFRDLDCDFLINNNAFAKKTSYPIQNNRTVLCGLEYNFLNKQLFSHEREKKDKTHVLLTTGGEDPGGFTAWLIKNIEPTLFEGYQFDVIIGPSHPCPEIVFKASQESALKITHHIAPNGLIPYIKRAHFAFTACGTTCYELIAARIPMFAIAVEDHQLAMADKLQKQCLLTYLGGPSPLCAANVNSLISQIKNSPSELARIYENQCAYIHGAGSELVVKLIKDKIGQ
ncbi:hypothetical protein [Terasakiella sp. SH-1]|uniref:PseG/SpsG family protein n=1 Tax=Terasakiella sp. SH-1 TaxID=2560057 RepID=UPI001072FEFD|nr:hypothetical protein [Terasakiella sp. SH-1]